MATSRIATRIVLALVILSGIAFTVLTNSQLSMLRQQHNELRMQVGLFEDGGTGMVRLVRMSVPPELLSTEIAETRTWRYRLSFPANYCARFQDTMGLVKADSPGGWGSSSSRYGDKNSERTEMIVSISFVRVDGRWTLSVKGLGGSHSHTVPQEFSLDSLDDLVIEEGVDFNTSRAFGSDQPICLLRIRGRSPVVNRDGTEKEGLYQGFVCYIYEEQQEKEFEAWANGKIKSMGETTP